jgi:hypothetical protein
MKSTRILWNCPFGILGLPIMLDLGYLEAKASTTIGQKIGKRDVTKAAKNNLQDSG